MNGQDNPLASGFDKEDPLSKQIIGAAIAVHKTLGPGLLESVYHECMLIEMSELGLNARTEVSVPLIYRGRTLKNKLRIDMLVNDLIIVELKAVDAILPIHEAQLLTYMRLTRTRMGLLFNFKSQLLRDSIRRLVL